MESFAENGPFRLLVATFDDAILGYASSSRFKNRSAYDTSIETTIYLDPPAAGRGVGMALYSALLAQLNDDPRLHRAYGGITQPNEASVRLHEKLGFRLAGTYNEVGYKFGKYWDVAWYEKELDG